MWLFDLCEFDLGKVDYVFKWIELDWMFSGNLVV